MKKRNLLLFFQIFLVQASQQNLENKSPTLVNIIKDEALHDLQEKEYEEERALWLADALKRSNKQINSKTNESNFLQNVH